MAMAAAELAGGAAEGSLAGAGGGSRVLSALKSGGRSILGNVVQKQQKKNDEDEEEGQKVNRDPHQNLQSNQFRSYLLPPPGIDNPALSQTVRQHFFD